MASSAVGGLSKKQFEAAEGHGAHRFYSGEIARLAKLLDLEDATLLIFAYHAFPDELTRDLNVIEKGVNRRNHSAVNELLRWYNVKTLDLAANVKGEKSGLLPKRELQIFKMV